MNPHYAIIVIGGGHAGAEAAWAASNILRADDDSDFRTRRVALITMDKSKIGQMSCNPAIGGLAKGQMVNEIDALGGLMALAIDATGIQFRMLNRSKGPAVRGPRAQADKYAYAREVQRLLNTRPNLDILQGTIEEILVDGAHVVGVRFSNLKSQISNLLAPAVILTTGTFMRGLMHTGPTKTPGGRVGEQSAQGISHNLRKLGFDLGRLKTGTPPRLARESIDFTNLELQPGDNPPTPFSFITAACAPPPSGEVGEASEPGGGTPNHVTRSASNSPIGNRQSEIGNDNHGAYSKIQSQFPYLQQLPCHITHTNSAIHDRIRANLHRAPMYSGQIDAESGPRYCPSIEDKVVRFADKPTHQIFLEPESHDTNEIYVNGISTSLPADVQDFIVANLPGCQHAKILRYGYAVEYDMVRPHQIDSTTMTKKFRGLFLAGQINGTSGYEEAAGQGLVAGLNAARYILNLDLISQTPLVRLGRDQAYIGVLLDDLVTRTPREPYRMFTSRAEHRLILRSDNAPDRLTPLARTLGLIDDTRWQLFNQRTQAISALEQYLRNRTIDGRRLIDHIRRPQVTEYDVLALLTSDAAYPPTSGEVGEVSEPGGGTSSHCARSITGSHPPLPLGEGRGEGYPQFGNRQSAIGNYDLQLIATVLSNVKYSGFIERHNRQHARIQSLEHTTLPTNHDYSKIKGMRNEAHHVLNTFRPATLGQASRLAGITPADLTVLSVALNLR